MFAATVLRRCQTSPDRTFLRVDDRTITYGELLDTVRRTASLLDSRGVGPGDHVLLTARNSPTFIYLWFAIRWVGAVCVPLHNQATAEHVRGIVTDADISFVAGDEDGVVELSRAGLWNGPAAGFADYTELERCVARMAGLGPVSARPGDTCSLLYTSGTTGAPKGVVLSDASFVAGGEQLAEALAVVPNDRILLALPLFHTNPQVYGVMTALATGCSLALVDKFRPTEFLDDAIRLKATAFTYVGTVLTALLRALPENIPPHRLRFCTGGGAPSEVWTGIEERLGVSVHELYGMTELGGWVTANHAGDIRRGTCGTPRPDVTVAVLDDEDVASPTGEPGEICIRPLRPHVIFDGYRNRSDATLAKMRNLWFHTGDVGVLDADGRLSFLGRTDDLIRRNGENVNPADVEWVLASHPEIAEVAVVGIPDELAGQEIRAVVVASGPLDPLSIPEFLHSRLPRLAWPRYVAVVDALPKTATQKIRSTLLRSRGNADIDLRAERVHTNERT
ncbi:AMP-binding protein [Rhodococcus sp. BP-241]|uniref:class I adenylate-forming enzyme family protein n=1 Tax=Rhodococcus sp. BP-241 TaxID=2739441 RepID=UPI001C9A6E09|nr:AMP-binding protein [Rhodococcus sp. BP-241]MBY6706442.1 AMP-binding protein [Rhodococcus sp. BP-241]